MGRVRRGRGGNKKRGGGGAVDGEAAGGGGVRVDGVCGEGAVWEDGTGQA